MPVLFLLLCLNCSLPVWLRGICLRDTWDICPEEFPDMQAGRKCEKLAVRFRWDKGQS